MMFGTHAYTHTHTHTQTHMHTHTHTRTHARTYTHTLACSPCVCVYQINAAFPCSADRGVPREVSNEVKRMEGEGEYLAGRLVSIQHTKPSEVVTRTPDV